MKKAAVLVLMGFGVVLGAACGDNAKATDACKGETSSDSCSACCTKNGASGHKFVTGSPCGCLGGG
jgi:hypothetical protein